ncbi:TPA: hypothetical protein IU076_002797 [Enterococcus faecalis]|jgi:hypothetical protein|uniref:Uncharacterized protein n=2 Tax=Enterococcus faecalis TaxID=1351 RepID=A0AAW7KEN8_ENTFL|nr:hypothetical protein [Enterococcus faecalis]MDN3074457.1 hypothetical protein [Enterococcus faecalis]MDN3077238.1 hypothetical protein [Enterococcus faecalis]MDN3193696.1 hypothetical protein [Enterococcus faecalis]HAP5652790.1 hypothetical protein [Enterococcus faecalis]HBC7249264.1 hypothetical protein [Enterococcus faecalis]
MKVKILVFFFSILLLLFGAELLFNKNLNSNFNDLSNPDKSILKEYNLYCSAKHDVWVNFNLKKRSILAINDSPLGDMYLITNKKNVNNIYTKKIDLPKNFNITVYRISKLSPVYIRYKLTSGNFSTTGKKYRVGNINDVFYVKYPNDMKKIQQKRSSKHFVPFLVHESFHYYMQRDWQNVSIRGQTYSDKELDFLNKEYILLDKIKQELNSSTPNKENLINLSQKYISIIEQRGHNFSLEKLIEEQMTETIEGTAQYVQIKAAKIINYDYDILYFLNKTISFSEVIPDIKKQIVNQSIIGSDIVYSSGALLCNLLDFFEVADWQETLNKQTTKDPVTLYSLLKKFIDQQSSQSQY